jgi:hypothetical protein
MKKEVVVCDSCESVLQGGGIRLNCAAQEGEFAEETIDLCTECLTEVLHAYSNETGEDFLTVELAPDVFLVLRGDDLEDEEEAAALDFSHEQIVST